MKYEPPHPGKLRVLGTSELVPDPSPNSPPSSEAEEFRRGAEMANAIGMAHQEMIAAQAPPPFQTPPIAPSY